MLNHDLSLDNSALIRLGRLSSAGPISGGLRFRTIFFLYLSGHFVQLQCGFVLLFVCMFSRPDIYMRFLLYTFEGSPKSPISWWGGFVQVLVSVKV